MAAAEARAVWQRTANRCFVQEDAKRAPKLACCPSSSAAQQYDSSNANATNEQEQISSSFVPLNWNSVNSNLPPDTRWWLQLQPSFGCQKDFTSEQLIALGDRLEEKVGSVVPYSELCKERLDVKNEDRPLESPWMVSTAFMRRDTETRVDEMKTVSNVTQQPLLRKVDVEDYFGELTDSTPCDRLISKKVEEKCTDSDSPWVGCDKREPWWRISDRDELASLVAQKSLEHIENCDLPRPTQTMPVSRLFTGFESLDGDRIFSSSVSSKLHTSMNDPIGYPPRSTTSGSMDDRFRSSSDSGHPSKDTEKLYSSSETFGGPTAKDRQTDTQMTSETNRSRHQLLEALRLSQTRAREAEVAAQKAYSENDHIVKLFFRQASHLFAYKQWLHMLQLESLRLQLAIKDHQISTLLPVLPWMPLKRNKGKKLKRCSFCKYAVMFAVGLGLAGAGLLLGWTLGWLLPHI